MQKFAVHQLFLLLFMITCFIGKAYCDQIHLTTKNDQSEFILNPINNIWDPSSMILDNWNYQYGFQNYFTYKVDDIYYFVVPSESDYHQNEDQYAYVNYEDEYINLCYTLYLGDSPHNTEMRLNEGLNITAKTDLKFQKLTFPKITENDLIYMKGPTVVIRSQNELIHGSDARNEYFTSTVVKEYPNEVIPFTTNSSLFDSKGYQYAWNFLEDETKRIFIHNQVPEPTSLTYIISIGLISLVSFGFRRSRKQS